MSGAPLSATLARRVRPAAPAPLRPAAPALRVVATPKRRVGKVAFVLICLTIIAAGLVGVLVLNTALAAGAFEKRELEHELAQNNEIAESVTEELEAATSPDALAQAAKELGMIPAQFVAHLRLADGQIIGATELIDAAAQAAADLAAADQQGQDDPDGQGEPANPDAADADQPPNNPDQGESED